MGKTKLVRFTITENLRDNHPSIEQIFRAILSEIAKKVVAEGLEFEWNAEGDDVDTGSYFRQYKVSEDVKIETQLQNILSSLRDRGIDAIVKREKTSTYEEYVFVPRM